MVSTSVGVVGAGYVGLTTAACLAHLGHRVVCTDIDASKVDKLERGEVPIDEPGLEDLVREGQAVDRLAFVTGLSCLGAAEFVFLCVPTPMGEGGVADLGALDSALADLRPVLRPDAVLVAKSTIPVGTTARVAAAMKPVKVVSNPEFLREGHAVHDFLYPDRIVVGADEPEVADRVCGLYRGVSAPIVRTDPSSAELAKYASNAFLAMKLSYANVLAELCENVGARVDDVTRTMGLDPRIGPLFLAPGPGWGGSCLPKDTSALVRSAAEVGVDFALLRAAVEANARQRDRVVEKVQRAVGALEGVRIGLLGLAFKADTGDLRDSPALAVAERLAAQGASVTGYDPGVPASVREVPGIHLVDDPALVAKDAAAIVLLTEWPEFRNLDWAQFAELAEGEVVVDARNLLDPEMLRANGFRCVNLGNP